VYVIHAEVTDLNQMKLIPSFNGMIGEIIYKATFGLFVQTLGKDITSREFFIKIKSIFLFLLITNLQGMIPYTSTVTSSLSNTFFMALALFISIIVTILDKKGINYFLGLFMPPGCPVGLIFLLIPIEVISYSFRVVSLSVRLFANMMAGHTLLKVIVGFS
jgi:F-type H+-transporting ATPase subunit a